MTKKLKIDFVSDVSCPWCAVGLGGLEQALQRVEGEITADIHFQPFELNPGMGAEGQDISEHLTQKYGSTEAQQADTRHAICERGAEVGFEFNPAGRGRIWNTFDAHRLLYLAETEGNPEQQSALKKALLAACHTRSEPMGDHAVLSACAESSGLDADRVSAVLGSDEFEKEVRERQKFYANHGISSVPAVIINDKHLISGGQPTEVFVEALQKIAEEA
ncbi:DsbA family oxidoreductase [Granulosicoccus sp.]|nr:DsbA family oxidoreductase [Granulosicoccus sp.]